MASILLVEDEVWLAELYAAILTRAGHIVRHCHDAYAAIESIDQQCPDVIVLDIVLPYANGIQLLHEIASHNDLQRLAIIVCSNALPQGYDAAAWRQYGVRSVVDKATLYPKRLIEVVGEAYAQLSH
jgi:twitching motility two-component system response regulator PilH